MSKYRYLIWLAWRRMLSRPVLSTLLLLIIIFVTSSFIIMYYKNIGFTDAALEAFPAFLGELGEITTPIVPVQISIIAGLLASISFIVILTSKITSLLVESLRRGGSMAKRVNFSGHTIICGWNYQGSRIVNDLLAGSMNHRRGIVILADYDERPIAEEKIEFVKGDPARDEDLIRAGIQNADSVIVLTDFSKGAQMGDSEAVMIALAVESLNPEVHTCVQIMNSTNALHLKHANADEIICLDQMGGSLAVASALNHGVSLIISELLTFNKGSEIYRYDGPLSNALVGKEYSEVAKYVAEKHMTLLAIEIDDNGDMKDIESEDIIHRLPGAQRAIIVNPQNIYQIRKNDALFIASESKPSGL